MKIALVGRYGEGEILTGPERVARELFNELTQVNSDIEFWTYFFRTKHKRKWKLILFGFQNLSPNQNVFRFGIFKFIIELYKKKPKVIHLVTLERFEIIILLFKPFLKYRIVYTVHGIYNYERKIFIKKPSCLSNLKDLILERMIFKRADVLIFLSQHMINLAKNYYKFDLSNSLIIPNGVRVSHDYNPTNFKINEKIKVVFYNGLENSRNRGLEELLNIMTDQKLNNYHLSVIGEPLNKNFKGISFVKPMSGKVLFEFLQDKNILIDNLGYMPFSIFALEAIEIGLIPIVSDNSGISSFIKNGKNGFVYEANKLEQLKEILIKIAEGKYKLEEISKEAVSMVRELSWNNIMKQYLQVYLSLIT